MTKFLFPFTLVSLLSITARAETLNMVNVGAPAINCVFDSSCTIVVTDSTADITPAGTSGSGFLQSRTYRGKPGAPGAGLYIYEYRIDLRRLVSSATPTALRSLSIDFGPKLNALDFNGDGEKTDQVFVITSGGLGSVAPISAVKNGNILTFNFDPPVSGGNQAGNGQTSYFFGLVSSKPPKLTTGHAVLDAGDAGSTLDLQVRVPNH